MGITYMGIEARDSCDFDISVNFQAAADFIHRGLSRGGKGKEEKYKGSLKVISFGVCTLSVM